LGEEEKRQVDVEGKQRFSEPRKKKKGPLDRRGERRVPFIWEEGPLPRRRRLLCHLKGSLFSLGEKKDRSRSGRKKRRIRCQPLNFRILGRRNVQLEGRGKGEVANYASAERGGYIFETARHWLEKTKKGKESVCSRCRGATPSAREKIPANGSLPSES